MGINTQTSVNCDTYRLRHRDVRDGWHATTMRGCTTSTHTVMTQWNTVPPAAGHTVIERR